MQLLGVGAVGAGDGEQAGREIESFLTGAAQQLKGVAEPWRVYSVAGEGET